MNSNWTSCCWNRIKNAGKAIGLSAVVTLLTSTLSVAVADILDVSPSEHDYQLNISWSLDEQIDACIASTLHVESDQGLDNIYAIDNSNTTLSVDTFYPGLYTVTLYGVCDNSESETLLAQKNIPLQQTIHGLILDKPLGTGACRSSCPSRQHSTFGACVGNCDNFNRCINGNPFYNYVVCEPNTGQRYKTCDQFCGKGYRWMGTEQDYSRSCSRGKPVKVTICERK